MREAAHYHQKRGTCLSARAKACLVTTLPPYKKSIVGMYIPFRMESEPAVAEIHFHKVLLTLKGNSRFLFARCPKMRKEMARMPGPSLLYYFFNFAITFSMSSSSVRAATGRLFTNVNVFLRPGPQYE